MEYPAFGMEPSKERLDTNTRLFGPPTSVDIFAPPRLFLFLRHNLCLFCVSLPQFLKFLSYKEGPSWCSTIILCGIINGGITKLSEVQLFLYRLGNIQMISYYLELICPSNDTSFQKEASDVAQVY